MVRIATETQGNGRALNAEVSGAVEGYLES